MTFFYEICSKCFSFLLSRKLFSSFDLCFTYCVLCYCSEEVRAQMLNKYMSQPDYNFDKVNRASQACGPLVKWAIAQVYTYLA